MRKTTKLMTQSSHSAVSLGIICLDFVEMMPKPKPLKCVPQIDVRVMDLEAGDYGVSDLTVCLTHG